MKTKFCKHIFFALLVFVSCNKKPRSSEIHFHIHHAYGFKAVLETIPLPGEESIVIDSASIKSGDDNIILKILTGPERPYRLKVPGSRLDILVLNDNPEISIDANILKPHEYKVMKSPATVSLKKFLDDQVGFGTITRNEWVKIDSLKSIHASPALIDSMTRNYQKKVDQFYQRYINFADTVTSPAAFLYVYNNIDFGKNFSELREFIQRAARRFPEHTFIQDLSKKTVDYLKIFEEEYNVGQYLPELKLPDQNGNVVTIASFRGKYVFMDFWSTWCDICLKYDTQKVIARKTFPSEKFEIVSIALDSEKQTWQSFVEAKKYNWHQLIDEEMWEGQTIRLFKIDSIPFNFLLAPDGRILSKAIKPDSLVTTIAKAIR